MAVATPAVDSSATRTRCSGWSRAAARTGTTSATPWSQSAPTIQGVPLEYATRAPVRAITPEMPGEAREPLPVRTAAQQIEILGRDGRVRRPCRRRPRRQWRRASEPRRRGRPVRELVRRPRPPRASIEGRGGRLAVGELAHQPFALEVQQVEAAHAHRPTVDLHVQAPARHHLARFHPRRRNLRRRNGSGPGRRSARARTPPGSPPCRCGASAAVLVHRVVGEEAHDRVEVLSVECLHESIGELHQFRAPVAHVGLLPVPVLGGPPSEIQG